MTTLDAAVATHGDLEDCGPPPERLVREPPDDGVAWAAFGAAAAAPLIRRDHTTGQDGAVGFEALPGHDQVEFVESAEGGEVRTSEARPRSSVRHVEVFRMVSVGTSILGRPRRLSQHQLADLDHTLIWEEPASR